MIVCVYCSLIFGEFFWIYFFIFVVFEVLYMNVVKYIWSEGCVLMCLYNF